MFNLMRGNILSKYVIVKLIGKGAFGNVYRVRDNSINKHYAMKKINVICNRKEDNKNLITEIKVLKYTDCPYIVKLHDILLLRNNVCLVTEYANRGDLYNKIQKLKSSYSCFDENTVWSYFIQISLGIRYLHDNNIIHRDVKSSNIFIHRQEDNINVIKIGDFGISKIIKRSTNKSSTIIGTPLYMSPELYKRELYDKKVDIWALGCILFEMLELNPPFRANTIEHLSRKVKKGKFKKPICDYSTDISKIIPKLIEIDVSKRYSIYNVLDDEDIKKHMYLVPYLDFESKVNDEIYMSLKTPIRISSWITLSENNFDLKEIQKKKKVKNELSKLRYSTIKRKSIYKPNTLKKYKLNNIKEKQIFNKPNNIIEKQIFNKPNNIIEKQIFNKPNNIIKKPKKNILDVKKIYTKEYYKKFVKKKKKKEINKNLNTYLKNRQEARKRVFYRFNINEKKIKSHIPILPSIEEIRNRYHQPKRKIVNRKKDLLIKIGSKHEHFYKL